MTTAKSRLHPETLAAQGMGRVATPYRDIVPPIYVSTTYERGADGAYPGGRVYSRADNPSYDQAEALIASLEGAAAAMLFASGQAAAAALFQALSPGDCVLAPGAIVAVDSTSATPMLTRPIELGAHIAMHSATKYLNGHSDVVAGALATVGEDEWWQRIRYVRGGGGAVLGPVEAWLLLRG